ncbi:methyltransferase [Candidatus Uabimicrobium sp. HlEnr_7]|uniref:methyltransferase n=1 Tax=Candidatus Uabimicrobium helgolandensis TaxID=3095367 RepID=UPI003558B80F
MINSNLRFTTETMWEIYQKLQSLPPKERIVFEVINPDLESKTFNGEVKKIGNISYRYRSHKAWIDLAEILNFQYLTPEKSDFPFIKIHYQNLDIQNSWHLKKGSLEERYGTQSLFARINKLEEPNFLAEYTESLQKCSISKGMRILALGVNRGDELAIFKDICSPNVYKTLNFVGIDAVESSILQARKRFSKNHSWIISNINNWSSWDIGKFDILIAIGVLHSTSLSGKNILTPLLKKFLHSNSKIVLGFPNSRYIDGEIKFGAKSKNYKKPEWSLLLKDIGYYRRLLFRQGFNVTVTGKYYLFITGI